jgi:hypothetical protein
MVLREFFRITKPVAQPVGISSARENASLNRIEKAATKTLALPLEKEPTVA